MKCPKHHSHVRWGCQTLTADWCQKSRLSCELDLVDSREGIAMEMRRRHGESIRNEEAHGEEKA